jgi:dTDP-4-amino-4,6-dideoxygalactose transaminase
MYGQPADMDAIAAVAKKNSLLIVEDAAQAHGAAWRARRAGSLGHAAAWSFYPTKNLGAHGDAGAVTTDDPMLAERIRSLRSYGWRTRYSSAERGYNSRLDELQAAILRAKLPALDIWNGRRRSVAATYLASLGPSEIALPTVADDAYPSWHLFVVRSTERDELRHHLAELGVQTLVHYPVAPHRQPAFEALGYLPGSLPVAEALADEVVSLPIGPHLPDTAVDQVVEAVASFRHGAGPR